MKQNTLRQIFQRLRQAGECVDASEEPIYDFHVEGMNRALSQINTWEAVKRKFVLTTQQRCAGMFRDRVD